MNAPSLSARLAVCSWSLQPTSPQELIAAVRATGLNRVHFDPLRETPEVWGEWGEEVVVGTGDVNWQAFFAAWQEVGFTGDLCIEREAGTTRVADIAAARELVEGIQ